MYAHILQKLGSFVRISEVRLVTASTVYKLSGRINVKSLYLVFRTFNTIQSYFLPPYNDKTFILRHLRGSILITGIKHSTDFDNVVFPTIVEMELCLQEACTLITSLQI